MTVLDLLTAWRSLVLQWRASEGTYASGIRTIKQANDKAEVSCAQK
jgi:hypothetical protein